MKRNIEKGFTLVEVIVAIALLSVVIAPIGGIILHQTTVAQKNRIKSEAQQDAQLVMSAFRTKCLPASCVTSVTNISGISAMSDSTADMEFTKLVLKNNYTNEVTTYIYNPTEKALVYSTSASSETSTKIPNVEVLLSPLPDTASYATCKGLNIKVKSTVNSPGIKQSSVVNVENQFYFRNADK